MNTQDIQGVLASAAELVSGLPSHLQPVAYREAVRLLLREADATLTPNDAPLPSSGNVSVVPSPSTVKQHGARIHKVLFAVASLEREGEVATAAAVETFLRTRLAVSVSKIRDVLREAVPELLERSKDGSVFAYRVTPQGIATLTELLRYEAGTRG